jgi:hypothetical protein
MVLYKIIAQRELAVCDDKVFCPSSGDFQGIGFYHQSEGCWGQRKKALLARPYIVSIKTARLSLGVVPGPHCRPRFTPARPLSPGFALGDHSPSRDMPRRLLTPVMRNVLGADLHVTAEGIAKFASSALVPTGCLPGCVISASIMPLSGMCAVGRLQPSGDVV